MFPMPLVVQDSPAGQRVAVEIVKVSILLLQLSPHLVVLAWICSYTAGGLDRGDEDFLRNDPAVDQVEDSYPVF